MEENASAKALGCKEFGLSTEQKKGQGQQCVEGEDK